MRMGGEEHEPAAELTDAGYGRAPSRLDRLLYTPALSDWILSAYFMAMVVGLSRARPSQARDGYLILAISVLTLFLGGVYLFRLRFETRGYGYRLAYHLLPLVALLSFYFNLRPILPIINGASYDDPLYQLDV